MDLIRPRYAFAEPTGVPLTVGSTNVTACFHDFRADVKAMIDSGQKLTYESHVQHLLALSSILLLKPARMSPDLHKRLSPSLCDQTMHKLLNGYCQQHYELDCGLRKQLEDIIRASIFKGGHEWQDSKKIMDLMGKDTPITNKILLSLRNLLETLPLDAMNEVDETELITRYANTALAPLLEDLKQGVMLRWTSAKDDNDSDLHPDSNISVMIGTSFGASIGYGEAKCLKEALNHAAIGKDLMRLGHFAKRAIVASKKESHRVLTFFVVGNHITFYLVESIHDGIYTMVEIAHIQLPMCLKELRLYVSQAPSLGFVANVFHNYCRSETTMTHHEDQELPASATLEEEQLAAIMSPSINRKRKSSTSHYNN
ncbi:hypothetical protein BC940DRAFT_333654 [Gongronella butleri]|nr:hypothetical protein BC940DRAFT_333654 [Gongronella butleri]